MAEIEEVIRGSFRVMINAGNARPSRDGCLHKIKTDPSLEQGRNKRLARQVTEEAVVLLKNQNNLLPLDKSKLKSIAWSASGRTTSPGTGIAARSPIRLRRSMESRKGRSRRQSKLRLNNDNNAAVDAARPRCGHSW